MTGLILPCLRKTNLSQTLRHPEILELARKQGTVTVDALAQHFDVTLQTIRRDLTELAETGKLERVHGGAVLPSSTTNIEYAERGRLNEAAKTAIARTCARHVPDGTSLFLNIGTTTEAVARALMHHRDLMVVTNNMNVAEILRGNPECQITVTGGALRRSDGGLLGHQAIQSVEQFKLDLAVIGCSALDEDGDLLDFDSDEVSVTQALLARSRKAFLVADHSKFSRHAPGRIASLARIEALFTDKDLPGDLTRQCRDWNTDVHLCDGE